MGHHTWTFYFLIFETRSHDPGWPSACCVVEAALELLMLLPPSASGTGMRHPSSDLGYLLYIRQAPHNLLE